MVEYTKEIKLCAPNNGYLCFMDKTHPLAHLTGRVYLHRHLASIYLGRWLNTDEQVHHINEDILDNSEENLLVCTIQEHNAIHKGLNGSAICPICNSSFNKTHATQKFCSRKCTISGSIINKEITKDLLDTLIPLHTWVSLGKLLGYTDSGVKKRAKSLGCNIPLRRKSN